MKEGLSQSSVFAITQDSDGFMWFGTRNGLNKFDGYGMKVFRKTAVENSLIDNDVRVLYTDTLAGHLWIGTLQGLSRYSAATETFTNYGDCYDCRTALSDPIIHCIYRDHKDRLWVGTAKGLNLYDDKTDDFEVIHSGAASNYEIANLPVKAIHEDVNGNSLRLGTEKGLFELETKDDRYVLKKIIPGGNPRSALSTAHIKTITEDKQGDLWIGTHARGIFHWTLSTGEIKSYRAENRSLSHNNIRSVAVGPESGLWVGTFAGLNYFSRNSGQFQPYLVRDRDHAVPGNSSVRSVFFDASGSLWAGTYFGGVHYFHPDLDRFRSYRKSQMKGSLSHSIISCFEEDPNGNIWIGTDGGGLNYFDRKTDTFSSYEMVEDRPSKISGNNIKAILRDGQYLWIGTFEQGLNKFEPATGEFTHYKQQDENPATLTSNNIYGLLKREDELWIATYGGGLNIFDLIEGRFSAYQRSHTDDVNAVSSNECRVLFEDSEGQVWLGTENGLDLIKPGPSRTLQFTPVLNGVKVYVVTETKDGLLWVGTYFNGLISLDRKTLAQRIYTTADGLPGNSIMGILEDDYGNLWLSSKSGIAKMDREQESFTSYGYADGLSHLEFNFNAYAKSRNGELLFGGVNGITLFHPDTITSNHFVPPLVFTYLKVNNEVIAPGAQNRLLQRSINQTESLTFAYNQANFSIGFAALDYFKPSYNNYAYKLDGLDAVWNFSIGEVQTNYTLQRPGTYTFRVKGGNSDDTWNPTERRIQIKVLPPPWRSGWAYGIYTVCLLGLIYFAYFLLQLQHQLQMKQVEKKQQEELHQVKLRFFTNITHELRTPLTLILSPIEEVFRNQSLTPKTEDQLNTVRRNAQRLLALVNQLLIFRKLDSEHMQLVVTNHNIVLFLREIFVSFGEMARNNDIDFSFHSSTSFMKVWYDQDKIEKVFYNLLSNAFKYTPTGGEISIAVRSTTSHCLIEVSDNGIGIAAELHQQIFKRFYEKEANFEHSFKGTGIGLAYSKQIVNLHHGQISVNSSVGRGATFTVALPLGRKHFRNHELQNKSPHDREEQVLSTTKSSKPIFVKSGKKIRVLVIEDNDDLRQYVKELLKEQYDVILADNGKEGLQLAKEKMPDLIISDIVMPIMDGIALCQQLKAGLETSHIPIILITAHRNTYREKGLQTGANDFIIKPFSSKELKLKIQNLINLQKSVHQKITRSITLEPKEMAVTSADEKFLEKSMEIIEKHISNPSFDVEQFAYELAVSRPLLFNKVKSLTGLTPNNFTKTVRLRRAAQLLQQRKLNVSQIAYMVGFRDPKYFSKCFQKQFGKTPTQFVEESGDNGAI